MNTAQSVVRNSNSDWRSRRRRSRMRKDASGNDGQLSVVYNNHANFNKSLLSSVDVHRLGRSETATICLLSSITTQPYAHGRVTSRFSFCAVTPTQEVFMWLYVACASNLTALVHI